MKLEEIQSALRNSGEAQGLDGWLFYDHHHRDPIAYRILGLDEHSFVSRRWFYFVPASGEPRKLVHRIEAGKLDALPGSKREYSSWQELEASLAALLDGATNVAMQYSPRNAIMYVSMVDAGTVELVRSMGKNVVSSADLVSLFEAVLSGAQIASHFEAQRRLDEVLRSGWQYLSDAVRSTRGETDEFAMVAFFQEAIERAGLWTDHGPNCSAGPNSADSHYESTSDSSRPIKSGDFVLIDIWAKLAASNNPKEPDPGAIWYDITWTGVVGREPTDREQLIFRTVRDARDAAITTIQSAYAPSAGPAQPIAGWQADDAARNIIRAVGFGDFFTHRTGHNIEISLHGNGAHLDNLETHDERLLLPNTCFSVEPGIYFPGEFGVRSEVNMITRPGKAIVSGPAQTELLRL
jgi:Xaa-Pro dipeptidase